MNFEIQPYKDIVVIRINVITANAEYSVEFKNLLLGFFNDRDNKKFIIDFSMVEFIDSAFLGAMVYAYRTLKENHGEIAIAGLSAELKFRFGITKLDNLFTICPSTEDALIKFK